MDKPYRLADRDGLYLDVRVKSKSWRYRFRFAGSENVYTFGRYPEMGRDEAREALTAVRKLLAQGKDPSQEKKLERIRALHQNAQTFQARLRRVGSLAHLGRIDQAQPAGPDAIPYPAAPGPAAREPSRADEALTLSLKAALSLVDIKVLDHFVVAGHGVVSLAERGAL